MNSLFNYQSLMYQEIFKSLNYKSTKNNIMKSLRNILTMLALIGFVTIANATDDTSPVVNIEQVANEKVKLSFENSNDQNSYLTISNILGEIIYSEDIDNPTYAKVFDLHILKDGEYTIQIEFENRTIKQAAVIEKNVMTLGLFETIAKPVFFIEEKTISVQISNIKNTTITVEITDEDDFSIYKKTEMSVDNFRKIYVLNQLEKGDYIIHVTLNNQSYSKFVFVK
jgi:hypothetical protein